VHRSFQESVFLSIRSLHTIFFLPALAFPIIVSYQHTNQSQKSEKNL
jgi:hypothetical protein